jgi:ribosomal protein L11 methyltransferase
VTAVSGAIRWDLSFGAGADPDSLLTEALAEFQVSWVTEGEAVRLWAEAEDSGAVREALRAAGIAVRAEETEPDKDWVAESAALRTAVAVGRFLFDPHEGERASPALGRTRIHLPAARAFGTGSHESTRLAVRLLLQELVPGQDVLDVGCGAGTLSFVAALQGAGRIVALDLDPDSAVATREHARSNTIAGVSMLAGPVAAIRSGPRFDLVVANMLQEEVSPILSDVRDLLRDGGSFLTAGQLRAREAEWLGELAAHGFGDFRTVCEGEWLGVASTGR